MNKRARFVFSSVSELQAGDILSPEEWTIFTCQHGIKSH